MGDAVAAVQSAAAAPVAAAQDTSTPATTGFSPPEYVGRGLAQALADAGETLDDEPDDEHPAVEKKPPTKPEQGKVETKEAPKGEKPKALPDVNKLAALAKEGKFVELIRELGVDPDGTKVPSDRFAELRKATKREHDKIAGERAAFEATKAEVRQHTEQLVREFGPLVKARAALQEGDLVGALELFAGEDFDKLSEKALRQKLASDPETIKLKRKLEAREKADEDAKKVETQRAAEQRAQQIEAQNLTRVHQALTGSQDPVVQAFADHKDFPNQVMRAWHHFHKTEGLDLTADEAAHKVIDVLRQANADVTRRLTASGGASTESSGQPATQAENTSRAGISPENQRRRGSVPQVRAAVTLEKPESEMSSEELLEKYKRKLARETTQERLARG
jgi:hypothetical protein